MADDERDATRAGRSGPLGVVRALGRGSDDDEFSDFFVVEYARVVRTVYLVVHDHGRAEEIAQDAFVQLLEHWSTVAGYDQPGAWVRRVAIRIAVRSAGRERARAVLERRTRTWRIEPPADLPLPESEVLTAVRELPTNQRVAVVLFYFEDRPVEEIADALGCAPATARVHLHKARQRLAALLHEEVDDVVG
ncbi:MAG: sigma-70 family RNA polymerase sigma factor [Actinomycetota bacterium]|nr:sigma-70 family RNA polymerase sigma factor [Actinomycetota bacterium]